MKLGLLLSWLAALLFAALVPAVLFYVPAASGPPRILSLAFSVALSHALVLGLPAALLFHYFRLRSLVWTAVAGFAIGALPVTALILWTWSGPFNTWTGRTPTVISGVPTWAGILEYAMFVGGAGFLGIAGAAAFRATLAVCGAATINASPPHTRRGAVLASVAVVAAIIVFEIPEITKDRSCHNMFRDGRTSVVPRASLELSLPVEERPKLATVLEQFAAFHGLQFRAEPPTRPPYFSLCNEGGLVITGQGLGGEFMIGVHYLGNDDAWQPATRELIAELNRGWTGRLQFRDSGHAVAWPPGLSRD